MSEVKSDQKIQGSRGYHEVDSCQRADDIVVDVVNDKVRSGKYRGHLKIPILVRSANLIYGDKQREPCIVANRPPPVTCGLPTESSELRDTPSRLENLPTSNKADALSGTRLVGEIGGSDCRVASDPIEMPVIGGAKDVALARNK